jgi:membrane protease YdiL (CAAX protease family)
MKKDFLTTKRIIYLLVSLFTFIVVLTEIEYSQTVLGILMTIILGLFLTQWYIFVGLIKSRDEKGLNIFKPRPDGTLLPKWVILSLSTVVSFYVILLGYVSDDIFTINGAVVIFLYVMGPAVFLLIKKWYMLALTALWVWFPIEWDVISDAIHINLGLPFPALLGLFALLWPAIMLGRHVPWYDWNITKSDLKPVNISILALTIITVPLGILLLFLKINFNEFAGKTFGESLGLILFTFMAIFLVQGIMEESLFRDIIMKHSCNRLKKFQDSNQLLFGKLDYGVVSILLGGLLIISIPFWGSIIRFIADIIPLFEGVASRVGDLHQLLGTYEGIAIPAFENYPVWPFYLIIGILLTIGGLFLYLKTKNPLMAALAFSAMIFGFAHFQDWRYVLFATFAGYGYGYTYYKTKNLAAAALVHMGVDAIWSLILSYP